MALPSAVPGTGSLGLIAGVGYLPAVTSLYGAVVRQYSLQYPDGYSALALSTLPSALSTYRQVLTVNQVANASRAISDALGPLNDVTYGLLPYSPLLYPGSYISHTDIVLNSWASWLSKSWTSAGLNEVRVFPFSPFYLILIM